MKFRTLAGLMLGSLCLAATALAQTAWKPTERINYIVGVAPGGTVDLYARGIRDALDRLKLANGQTRGGREQGRCWRRHGDAASSAGKGNAHYLGTFHTGAIAGAVTGLIKADPREFVPVAMMVEETSLVAVRADSPLKRQRPGGRAEGRPHPLRIAVAPALGQNTHWPSPSRCSVAGVAIDKLTIAPFRSSGESVTALMGGHVDVVSATAPVMLPQVAAGKLRILASAAPEPGSGPLAGCQDLARAGRAGRLCQLQRRDAAAGRQCRADPVLGRRAAQGVAGSGTGARMVEKSGNKPIFRGYVESHRYLMAEWDAATELARSSEGGAMSLTAPPGSARAGRRMGGRAGRAAGAPRQRAGHGRARGAGEVSAPVAA
jgi:putative tricarboxylic transport membrane protein